MYMVTRLFIDYSIYGIDVILCYLQVHVTINHFVLQTDASGPSPGFVWDGLGLYDLEYTNNAIKVSVSHSGFSDEQSGIHHYLWCVGTTAEGNLKACHNIGLRLQATVALGSSVKSGNLLFQFSILSHQVTCYCKLTYCCKALY